MAVTGDHLLDALVERKLIEPDVALVVARIASIRGCSPREVLIQRMVLTAKVIDQVLAELSSAPAGVLVAQPQPALNPQV